MSKQPITKDPFPSTSNTLVFRCGTTFVVTWRSTIQITILSSRAVPIFTSTTRSVSGSQGWCSHGPEISTHASTVPLCKPRGDRWRRMTVGGDTLYCKISEHLSHSVYKFFFMNYFFIITSTAQSFAITKVHSSDLRRPTTNASTLPTSTDGSPVPSWSVESTFLNGQSPKNATYHFDRPLFFPITTTTRGTSTFQISRKNRFIFSWCTVTLNNAQRSKFFIRIGNSTNNLQSPESTTRKVFGYERTHSDPRFFCLLSLSQ